MKLTPGRWDVLCKYRFVAKFSLQQIVTYPLMEYFLFHGVLGLFVRCPSVRRFFLLH